MFGRKRRESMMRWVGQVALNISGVVPAIGERSDAVLRTAMGGDPVFQSVRDSTSDAAEYWMPAFAGMTAEIRSKIITL